MATDEQEQQTDEIAIPANVEQQIDDWRLWCRLCAKNDAEGNINVFLKSEQTAPGDMALATAIGKYFWVNITRNEELPEMICSECLSLVTSLVNFSERITRVQKLYCILQSTAKESINLLELRAKFGLLEDQEQEEQTETLTEVHYVEEKPKLNELEEATLELENPLTPCRGNVDKLELNDRELEQEEEGRDAAEDAVEDEEPAEEYEEASTELLLNLYEAFSNADSDESSSSVKQQPGKLKDAPKTHQCSECTRSYALPQTLQRHIRQEHAKSERETKLLPCEQCDKMFRSHYQLQRHMQQHLPMPKRKLYPCPSCGKKFTTNASAQSHAQYMHQEERPRPVICEQCGIAVHSLNALKEHLLSHTDYAPYECEVCKKCFKSVSRLKHHKETHDPHKYICPECGMQLNSRPTLNRHRLVHTDQMQHKCDYCGREFKRAKALKNHLILHTGLKPYSCDFCDRTFANGSNCRTHKKKAHPEELAAQEAAGGGKSYNRNIPKLEALKAFTKNKDNLSPVATKQSGCFAFGKKPKMQQQLLKTEAATVLQPVQTAAAAAAAVATVINTIPTIENIYNHIMKQTPDMPTQEQQQQQQLVLSSDGSATIMSVQEEQQELAEHSNAATQMFSY
ncbi:zinc finger protein weckle [Drosophila nasuta]|uniref:zinc finger protein weckle n=1 Tax=Drosophila nasuta TaxID=42062 RepID=UPI00295F5919|nr:zinc finger protein weckle [Drosophila nasuta]